jgi:hypothetical protein
MDTVEIIEPAKVDFWKHEGVDEKGRVEGGGAVGTQFSVRFFFSNNKCNCASCSTPHSFIVKNYGLENGTVQGKTIYFNTDEDMKAYIEQNGIREIG